ncbi:MAG: threonine synthase [Candidatus Omnitrophica bacterium]|nr:threonine synthase [Candidatus Omnitrophota bacterium]
MSAASSSTTTSRPAPWRGVIEAYRVFLPVSPATPIVTLLEGNTPLLYSKALSGRLGEPFRVYLKYEGANPTGSFKDRGMTVAISKAVEAGSRAVLCASTGNTSAAASAYAARAGLRSIVLIPSGNIAMGKLSQALIHGARVAAVNANFDVCLELVRTIADRYPVTVVNSINPFRIEGQKTCAFEICDTLGRAPDFHLTPVGNAGNITAQWKGYREYHKIGRAGRLPVMLGFQAKGASPIVSGRVVKKPNTIATAIRIGNPASWRQALAARDESHGRIEAVTDRQILEAYQLLAQEDGVFVEPASAASVAGLLALAKRRYFRPALKQRTRRDEPILLVCILTGHGLKDPERAIQSIRAPRPLPPDLKAISTAVGLH